MLRGKVQGWTTVSASAGVTSAELDAEVRPERPELPVTPARLRSLREKGPRDDDQLGRGCLAHRQGSELSRTPVDHLHGLPPMEPPSPSVPVQQPCPKRACAWPGQSCSTCTTNGKRPSAAISPRALWPNSLSAYPIRNGKWDWACMGFHSPTDERALLFVFRLLDAEDVFSVKLSVGWQTSRAEVCSGEAKVTIEENVVTVQIPERMRSCVVEL